MNEEVKEKRHAIHFYIPESKYKMFNEIVKRGYYKNRFEVLMDMIEEFAKKYGIIKEGDEKK